jgi:mycofactocin system creatininase family protein
LIDLGDMPSPEVGERARAGAILAVPLGSTEQHGAHLPLSTDTDIAVELCRRLAAARSDVVVAPALAFGSSGEHAGFPGTLSIGQAALETVVVELGRSASDTFDHLLLVSAHGGNLAPLGRAAERLRAESRDVCVFMPCWEGDPHAGRPETSMLLALSPQRVLMEHAAPGDERPLAEVWTLLRSGGVRAVSESGVLGDPTGASDVEGAALLDALERALRDAVDAWRRPRER